MNTRMILIGGLLAAVLSACGGKQGATRIDDYPDPSRTSQSGDPIERVDENIASGGSVDASPVQPYSLDALNDPNSPLAERVILFAFDSDEIDPRYHNALSAHAQLLVANPQVTVRLEGHSDERGSREYNVGLANRRAIAVQRWLELQGVPVQQMEPVSYGEEKPNRYGHSEADWAENRRVELVYNRF